MRLIDADDFDCENCRHHRTGKCDTYCEVGEQYSPDITKLTIIDPESLRPQWIPVAEERPKRRGRYFISYKFKGSDQRFFGEAMWHNDLEGNGYVTGPHFTNEGAVGMYVTHWMEIPEIPDATKEK